MKAPALALLLLANQSASTAYLCESNGDVMAYQMIGDDSACEIQLYPPNHPPKTIWRGGGCLGLMLDILGLSEGEGWRCDLPALSRRSSGAYLDAREQGIEVDRLGEIVIGADAQTFVDGLLKGQSRKKQEGRVAEARAVLKPLPELIAVHARHPDIRNDHIRVFRLDRRQTLDTITSFKDVMAGVFEFVDEQFAKVEVILDDNDFRHG